MRIDLLPSDENFYKANLHCHSRDYDSAAGLTVAQLKELYKSHGYNIFAFSEHEKLTYNNELNDEDFLALSAFETGLFDPETRRIFHFNCFPKHDKVKESYANFEYSLENANKRIQSIVDEGYLVVYNHPVSSFHESNEYLGLKGIFAMEVYNNVVEIINRTGWSDVYYDMMLRHGHEIWAVAADDCHAGTEHPVVTPIDTPYSDCMGGFVMIKAKELKHANIINALEKGDFYSCVGKNGKAPQIHSMYVENNIFYADFSPVKSVYLKNSYWHCPHQLSYEDDITHVEFEIDTEWTYIRLEITDTYGHKALGNPYFLT